jgi:hypothetical protein
MSIIFMKTININVFIGFSFFKLKDRIRRKCATEHLRIENFLFFSFDKNWED